MGGKIQCLYISRARGFLKWLFLSFVVCRLLEGGWAHAQASGTILGSVTNKATGKPVPFVNVILKGTRFSGVTDSSGCIELKGLPAGSYTLEFRHVGYDTVVHVVEVQEGGEVHLSIQMNEKLILLPEVAVIDSSEISPLLHQYPGSKIITRGLIEQTGATIITEALQELAPRFQLETERARGKRNPPRVQVPPTIILLIDGLRIYPNPDDIYQRADWLSLYVSPEEIDVLIIHRGANAWMRAGRRGESVNWLLEIRRRR